MYSGRDSPDLDLINEAPLVKDATRSLEIASDGLVAIIETIPIGVEFSPISTKYSVLSS
jgi:hypothetical protein